MTKPRALDLFCGGGGACEGLMRAGFDVVGVDIVAKHAKHYPGTFVHGDALNPPFNLNDFDFVWASPPCQHASVATPTWARDRHVNLIPETRRLLEGHPFAVIENVPGAEIRRDLELTGPMVDLPEIERRRFFELSWFSLQPCRIYATREAPPIPVRKCPNYQTSTMKQWKAKGYHFPSYNVSKETVKRAMGIEANMTLAEMGEAVPPAYAEFIGRQVMQRITA